MNSINVEEYRDKVLGCWTGKNIGGTLGAPFEGIREVQNVSFYTQDLKGEPEPNDDLDLQLIWLLAAEENGIYHLNERILGEYWLSHITGPWNEYGVCKGNIRNGLYPPLSGSCNNDTWKYSNGAWIRSEIWACIFPGAPDEAAQFAYYDSCCDHCGEGIYAEIFTASIESAAFFISDIRSLIKIGLARIPADCRVARSIGIACDYYDKGKDFLSTREALVKDSEDLGWFQAPANIGFVIIGLLYGEGDFGKSICIANNCGDDTDCTAGTAGAIMGIICGRSGIPDEWIAPIGESIRTCSIDTYGRNNVSPYPKSVNELTERVIKQAVYAQIENPSITEIVSGSTDIDPDYLEKMKCPGEIINRIWNISPYEMAFDLPYGIISVNYDQGPEVIPGECKKITVKISNVHFINNVMSVKLLLPDGWQVQPCNEAIFTIKHTNISAVDFLLTPGSFDGGYYYLPIELRLADRMNPVIIHFPLQRKESVKHYFANYDHSFSSAKHRCDHRIKAEIKLPSL